MKKMICLFAVILSIIQSMQGQLTNKNEYVKINDDYYTQYSPKEKGWVIFKYDNNNKLYVKQDYSVTPSNSKQSLFKSLFVGDKYNIFTYDQNYYKKIGPTSNEIYSEYYKDIIVYNLPHKNGNFPLIILKQRDNQYINSEGVMSCDTFEIQNGNFIPIFNKDNPKINENIYTQNGFVVPHLYPVLKYTYSIRKTQQGYIISDRGILYGQSLNGIHSYPEMGMYYKNPEIYKQFPQAVNLSYYDGNNFLISEKNKWYVCKVTADEQNLNSYLSDVNRILPKDETLYSYFGDLEANSIRVLTWESGNPAYFIANIKGVDYLYDYRKAEIKDTKKKIIFPQMAGISGEYIKPYYIEKGFTNNEFGKDEKPKYLIVKQGGMISYYKYLDNEFKKIENNPFKGKFMAVFEGSTCRMYNVDGTIKSEKTFSPEMTSSEIAEENDLLLKQKESAMKESVKKKADLLKYAIMVSQNQYYKYVGNYSNSYFYSFPMKYYNGNQLFFQSIERGELRPNIINNNDESVALNNCSDYLYESDRGNGITSASTVLAVGASGKTERITFSSPHTLPDINSSNFQEIGQGISTYDEKGYIITKTFSLTTDKTQGYSQYVGSKLLPFKEIFKEAPDVREDDVDILYSTRLSNNDILIILKAKITYLSGQLNRMFGIDGANKISRTFETATYNKFIIISEDGSMLKSNRNYLLQMTFIRPIDNGFIIMSEIGNIISLDEKDFGRKSFVYSQNAGKNILVTEGINFNANLELENGIKIFKFNNSADLVKEIVVDKPSDAKIGRPFPIYIQHSENYLCLFYLSFDQKIVNDCVYAFKLFDFDLNLKSTYVGNAPDVGGIPIRVLGDGNHHIPRDFGYITSMDDIFYIFTEGKLYTIPFK